MDDEYLVYTAWFRVTWIDVIALGVGFEPMSGVIGLYFGPLLLLFGKHTDNSP